MIIPFLFILKIIVSGFLVEPVYFESDQSSISDREVAIIKAAADYLNENPIASVEVAGHTDSDGSEEYNLLLSEKRAVNVKEKLVSFGVDDYRIKIHFFGFSKPVAENDSEENKAKNRRVEFEFHQPVIDLPAGYDVQKLVNVASEKVRITIYDHGRIDGDIVAVFLNGNVLVDYLMIDERKRSWELKNLKQGPNYIVVRAISQGSLGAATPMIIIEDGTNEYHFELNAYYDTPAAAVLNYIP